MTPELYACVTAQRVVRGLAPLPKTDPTIIEAARDPEIQRQAAVIKRKVARMPPLTDDQIVALSGLLPYPHPTSEASPAA